MSGEPRVDPNMASFLSVRSLACRVCHTLQVAWADPAFGSVLATSCGASICIWQQSSTASAQPSWKLQATLPALPSQLVSLRFALPGQGHAWLAASSEDGAVRWVSCVRRPPRACSVRSARCTAGQLDDTSAPRRLPTSAAVQAVLVGSAAAGRQLRLGPAVRAVGRRTWGRRCVQLRGMAASVSERASHASCQRQLRSVSEQACNATTGCSLRTCLR